MDASNPTTIETLSLLGGRLCLDFTNTIDPRIGNHPRDLLANYSDLVHWSLHADLLFEDEAEQLLNNAAHRRAEAIIVFERAITLREAIYRVYLAVARGKAPENADLNILKASFVEAMRHAQIIPTSTGFQWEWTEKESAFDQMLWPVARSAVELLTSSEIKKVKECPGAGDCGWLFLDMSKNGSRQWCSMEGCGSRVKMRRQYARKRSASTSHSG